MSDAKKWDNPSRKVGHALLGGQYVTNLCFI